MNDFVVADCGIRQLYARFSDAVWRKDAATAVDCFADDGEWKLAGMHVRGSAEIRKTFELLLGTSARIQIICGTPLLEVGQGTATGRIQVTELCKMLDGTSAMTMGVYYERYVESEGVWRFQWRHFGLHYRGPIDLSAALVDSPDFGAFPGMPAPEEPTITRRRQTSS